MKLRPLNLPLCLATTLVALAALPSAAHAQSLMAAYDAAKAHDATYAAAQAAARATQARADQSRAALMPTLGASFSHNSADIDVTKLPTALDPNYRTATGALSLSQPLYRAANIATYRQGAHTAALAAVQLAAAEQDLMVRTSQAYFDVLASREALQVVQAQKKAVAEQLVAAKRNFEVGTSTITDTREAQARHDLVVAQELAAQNDERTKQAALNQLVGQPITPRSLQTGHTLPSPQGQSAEQWVQQALAHNAQLAQLRVARELAQLEVDKAQAGHLPTLDLTASLAQNRYSGPVQPSGNSNNHIRSVAVTLNLPLFAGFAVQNRVKEALALEEKARADLSAAERQTELGTRAAYYGWETGLRQVQALEAARASSQSALEANQLGYQVGVRINIDVLNSQSQLFQTQRDLAKARYEVLLGQLKLRQTAGQLSGQDLQAVSALLAP